MAIKFVIGVWDTRDVWDVHNSLADNMIDTTLKFTKTVVTQTNVPGCTCIDSFVFRDLNTIFDNVNNFDYTHFLLVAAGCMIKNPELLIKGVKAQIDSNPGMCVSGQILHTGLWSSVNNKEFFTLHEQMMLFSKHALEDMQRDNFKFKTTPAFSSTEYRKIKRHEDNVHDNYTPLDISPHNDSKLISVTKTNTFGFFEDVIQYCMKTNWHIQNLNGQIRSSKHYTYHIEKPYEFEKYLFEDIETIEENKDNIVQGHYEFFHNMKVGDNVFWSYNTEDVDPNVQTKQYDSFVTLAAGPMPWIYLSTLDFIDDTHVHFVDISGSGLEFQKWFLENYEVNKFDNWKQVIDTFLQDETRKNYIPSGNPEMSIVAWDKQKAKVDAAWDKIKNFTYTYEKNDMLHSNDVKNFVKTHQNPFVWFSNIFRYHATFEKNLTNEDLQNFINLLITENRLVNWTGISPDNNRRVNGMCSKPNSVGDICKPYDIPPMNSELFFEEIQKLEELNLFTDHRGGQHPGWSSFALHGLGYDKTLGYENYGYENDQEAPYDWTPEGLEHCPNLVEYFKNSGIKKRYHRLRIMRLAPGGYISIHDDDPHNFKTNWALNIAINNPDRCEMHFWNDDFVYAGKVPWEPGLAFLIRIHWKHMVMNLSDTVRYHIIAHGEN